VAATYDILIPLVIRWGTMDRQDTPQTNWLAWRAWALVAALLTVATGFGFVWEPHVSLASQAMLYVLAVVIASYTLGSLASVVCALGAVTAFNFFFVPPRWTFEVDSQENLITLVTLLVVALVVSRLAANLRQKTAAAHLSAARARQMQLLSSGLAEAASPQAMLERWPRRSMDLSHLHCDPTTGRSYFPMLCPGLLPRPCTMECGLACGRQPPWGRAPGVGRDSMRGTSL
jgi:K+-sensing histidine kinase KdpD